jgi:ArsR family transcriptional regulator
MTELNNRLSMFLLVENKVTSKASNEIAIETKIEDHNQSVPERLTDFDPITFYKCLTDDIRLKTLMLTHYHGELCVCELMAALSEDSQPKVSRNLALLKKAAIITDRKNGQWVFYRINPNLPLWVKSVIAETTENNLGLIMSSLQQLDIMQNRPNKVSFCR